MQMIDSHIAIMKLILEYIFGDAVIEIKSISKKIHYSLTPFHIFYASLSRANLIKPFSVYFILNFGKRWKVIFKADYLL